MNKKNETGQINNNVYDDTSLTEQVETGKLDFDFLLGRHILHVNNLLSQDILGDTISGNSLGIQRCESALDILSNMIEIYTKSKDVLGITGLILTPLQLQKSNLVLNDELTYYEVYKEIRTNQFKRYNLKQNNNNKQTLANKQLKLIEYRYTQLSVIHRYLMLWIDECGLTPSTISGSEDFD